MLRCKGSGLEGIGFRSSEFKVDVTVISRILASSGYPLSESQGWGGFYHILSPLGFAFSFDPTRVNPEPLNFEPLNGGT
jgi:hypothetical protein